MMYFCGIYNCHHVFIFFITTIGENFVILLKTHLITVTNNFSTLKRLILKDSINLVIILIKLHGSF